jgi:outer membrane protein TolC
LNSSNKIYKEVFTKYKEGSANYLELMDAETQITHTKLQYNLAKYNAWLKWCEVYYSKGSYVIE